MIGEVDSDFYCIIGSYAFGLCDKLAMHTCKDYLRCRYRYHKWPTKEQFKKVYGVEYEGAGYYFNGIGWIQSSSLDKVEVCACTPWGKPPDDWRPE
jgi:hypothetical protein